MIFLILLLGNIDVNFQIERDTNLVPYVIVNYKIPYSELAFYKRDTLFESKYFSTITVKVDDHQIGGNSQRKVIKIHDYTKTISPGIYEEGQLKEKLEIGVNNILLSIWDLQSNRKWNYSKEIPIYEIKPLDIGSIRWDSDPSYELTNEDSLKVYISIFDSYKEGVRFSYCIEGENGDIFYQKDTLLKERSRHGIYVKLKTDIFNEGSYLFITKLEKITGEEIKRSELKFQIKMPFFKSKRYYERVEQLLYIAKQSEINRLRIAPIDKRKELWDAFWRKFDPTSGDEVNEFRVEYYRKVDYANQHFSTGLTKGWKSDRGKVYIILGPPDYIERHPFEMERKAYQIWYYDKEGYRLTFVERYNLGEYELINPPINLESY